MDVPSALLARVEQARSSGMLDLGRLGLRAVPPLVFELGDLSRLDLGHNNIASLPADIARLEKLEQLWLNDNPLAALPVELTQCRRLRVLDLRNTRVRQLPNEMGRMSRLADVDLRGTPLDAGTARAAAAGAPALVGHLFLQDREALLRKKMESKLRDGLYREQSSTPHGQAAIARVVHQVFESFKDYDSQRRVVRNCERMLPADPADVDVAALHATFVELQREHAMKCMAVEVEMKLRNRYYDEIKPERVEGMVKEIYRHVTVLEDMRFLVRHAAKLLPPDWRALDAAQLKADLYALRERMRRERAAAVDALRQALRSFYADAEPADVDVAAAAVAKKFSRVEDLKKLAADASVYFPAELRDVDPVTVRGVFATEAQAMQALVSGAGTGRTTLRPGATQRTGAAGGAGTKKGAAATQRTTRR